ncbi:MAG: c-type cytochrome [Ignavibacteriales bacterium]|nr:c-type cytochrome [Ignavibacteriales bacterium]
MLLRKTSKIKKNDIARPLRFGLLSTLLVSQLLAQDDPPDISILSGKEIYIQFCSRCHGDDGKGNIPKEMLQNMDAPPPDLTEPYFNSGEKRLAWFRVIKFGGDIECLSMSMPSWGESFSDRQIEEMVEHIKTFVPQHEYPQGEVNFLRAHAVTKAFVEQEALLIPTYTSKTVNGENRSETKTTFYYASRFGNRFQYELKAPIQSASSSSGREFGLGNLELGFKYAFFDDHSNGIILSTGIEAEVPTGDESKGFSSGTIIGIPYIAAGIGVGHSVEFQGSAKIDAPFNRSKANPELKYGFSTAFILSDSRMGLFPGIEITGTKDLTNRTHMFSIIPKLYVGLTKRGHVGFSVGSEIPVSSEKAFSSRWLAFLLWDYADGGLWW